jgi:phosphoglycerol transferase MdoB-like AlkP superfamily enzyme
MRGRNMKYMVAQYNYGDISLIMPYIIMILTIALLILLYYTIKNKNEINNHKIKLEGILVVLTFCLGYFIIPFILGTIELLYRTIIITLK